MTQEASELLKKALALSTQERAQLVDSLLESLEERHEDPADRRSRLERRDRTSHWRARLGQGQNYPLGRGPPAHFGQTDKWPLSLFGRIALG